VNAIAINCRSAPHRPMPLTYTPDQAERRLIAEALRNLREARRPKVFQPAIAERLGMSTQAWQKHEAGERNFTEEKIEAALEAIGASRTELEAEKARILGKPAPGLNERRSEFVVEIASRSAETRRSLDLRQLLGPGADGVEMADDEMSPWAERGELVLFDRNREPRRGYGCVVELKSGERLVRFYERSDGSSLFVRVIAPEERTVTIPLRDVAGVYRVSLRGGD
jgi:transcriptional regulator with XRE-family HTH domain